MKKEDMVIMVVPTAKLFERHHFNGFSHVSSHDYHSIILDNHEFMRRGEAEVDETYRQPIPYVILYNSNLKKYFAFQRASDITKAHEQRLHGKWSFGVGGHVDLQDSESVKVNVLHDAMMRELVEEVDLVGDTHSNVEFETLGFINEEESEVGRVHVGVLVLAKTNATQVRPKASEVAQGGWYSLEELGELCSGSNVEGWSHYSLEALKRHFD
jgi:predicted NUDIX family phosphoesterase